MKTFIETLFKKLIFLSLPLAMLAACAGSGDPIVVKNVSIDERETLSMAKENKDELSIPEVVPVTVPVTVPEKPGTPQMEVTAPRDETIAYPSQYIVYFPSDVSAVDSTDFMTIKQHADFLIQNPDVILNINGHADSQGSEQYNMTLSSKRAAAVAELLTQNGVPDSQLILAAHGEAVPAISVSDWEANRRVEFEYADPMTLSSR